MGRRRGVFGPWPKQWSRPGCAPKERGAWPRRQCSFCGLVYFAPYDQDEKSKAYREHLCVNKRGETEGQEQDRRDRTRNDVCGRCGHERRFHRGADGEGQCIIESCEVKPLGWTIHPAFKGKACPSFVESLTPSDQSRSTSA